MLFFFHRARLCRVNQVGKQIMVRHPLIESKRAHVTPKKIVKLHVPVWDAGGFVGDEFASLKELKWVFCVWLVAGDARGPLHSKESARVIHWSRFRKKHFLKSHSYFCTHMSTARLPEFTADNRFSSLMAAPAAAAALSEAKLNISVKRCHSRGNFYFQLQTCEFPCCCCSRVQKSNRREPFVNSWGRETGAKSDTVQGTASPRHWYYFVRPKRFTFVFVVGTEIFFIHLSFIQLTLNFTRE